MNSNNKRIAKNTIMLYIRMIVTMFITLYTSRVILNVLGVSDYGLYNVVGGMVAMFAFVNTTLSGCSQRYFNIALGKKDPQLCKHTFSVALFLHIILAIAFFVLMEILGKYLILNLLNIESGRIEAAYSVFHFSLISLSICFVYMPYEAAVIANEKMDFYAYLSIFDVVSKLGVVYALYLFPDVDRLILYAILLLIAHFIVGVVYVIYCMKNFAMCSLNPVYDKVLVKEMGQYTMWNVIGHMSYVISTQGYNIVYNHFLGTVINAARGLAVQIQGVVTKFTNSFQIAASPQIIKSYAAQKHEEMFRLAINTSKYSSYLFFLFGIPLFLEMDTVLSLWLTVVPENTTFFARIMLINCLITSSSTALDRIIVATGKVRSMNVVNLVSQLLFVGISYLLLSENVSILYVIPLMILPSIILYTYTLYLVHDYLELNIKPFIKEAVNRVVDVLFISLVLPTFFYFLLTDSLVSAMIVVLTSLLSTICSIFFVGLDANMRSLLKNKVFHIINKR